MKLKNILYVLKPVGKLFIVDKNGNSLAKIDAEGMTLYPVLVVEIKIKEKGE